MVYTGRGKTVRVILMNPQIGKNTCWQVVNRFSAFINKNTLVCVWSSNVLGTSLLGGTNFDGTRYLIYFLTLANASTGTAHHGVKLRREVSLEVSK